jgi:hypothetical protein
MDWSEIYNQIVRFLPRFEIVNPDQIGVLVRFGKFKKDLTPGVYFCFPYFDEVFMTTSVTQVVHLSPQSIRSRDNKTVAITCAAVFSIIDAELAILEIDDTDEYIISYIADSISSYVNETDFVHISIGGLTDYVMKTCSATLLDEVGVDLECINIYDLAEHKIIRLLSDIKKIDH